MRRTIFAILTLMVAFTLAQPTMAKGDKKKTKDKDEYRTETPEPDAKLAPLKPQKGLSPVPEIGKPMQPKQEITYHHTATKRGGIDVSHYQGQINWKEVAHDGRVLYVYIKSSESTSLLDNTYQYNLREARKQGLPVGSYHFFSPSASGEAQLKHFKATVDMSQQDLIPIVDIELRGKRSLKDFQQQIRDFLEGFEAEYHFKPMIYASVNFYNKFLAGAFDNYKYMLAKYGDECPAPNGPIPFVIWQYSAHGRIDGIRGAVDMSYFIDKYDLKDILIKYNRK